MTAVGMSAANSNKELDFQFFDAVSESEDEATELMVSVNMGRFENQIRIDRGY